MVKFLLTACFTWITLLSSAQNINAFAVAKSSRQTVFVEQALKVTVTVYTSTWFTEPLEIENLQVEGAFVQSFRQTLSSIRYVDKKKYASLEFYYIVFPYKDGTLTFPGLNIITKTPPEGDYIGKQVTLKTKAININVQAIPDNADKDRWLVANNASISNQWNTDLNTLKVGDVLKRTITTKANGTLPSFIDEPLIEDVDFGNIYTSEPKYIDERDDNSANGKRIDTYSYLLEKEGQFTIPEVELTWYNPYVGKFYKRKLPSYDITVSKNLDMEALHHLKDSLNAMNSVIQNESDLSDEAFDYKQWIIYGVGLILLIIILILFLRISKRVYHIIKANKENYHQSEAYWFKKLNAQKDDKRILATLYKWLDYGKFNIQQHTLTEIKGDDPLNKNLEVLKSKVYSSKEKKSYNLTNLLAGLKHWRKSQTQKSSNKKTETLEDRINP